MSAKPLDDKGTSAGSMFEFFPGHYRWSYNTLLAFSAGGQLGDFALIQRNLAKEVGKDEAWHREWARLADILERRGQAGSQFTAAENYFLASLYHTISEHFIPPASPERLASYKEVLRTFDLGREAAHHPVERVLVPFEGTTLPAYFVPGIGPGPRPTAEPPSRSPSRLRPPQSAARRHLPPRAVGHRRDPRQSPETVKT